MLVTPGAITYSTNVATANASNAFPPPRSVSSAYLRARGLYETTSARCAATLSLPSVSDRERAVRTRDPAERPLERSESVPQYPRNHNNTAECADRCEERERC